MASPAFTLPRQRPTIQRPTIQLASDLHLEFFSKHNTPPASVLIRPTGADILILAGDIVSSAATEKLYPFLRELRPNYQEILMVAGNHEFYWNRSHKGPSEAETRKLLEEICDSAGVRFLEKTKFETGSSVFLGTTLWSSVPKGYEAEIERSISDYSHVRGPEISPGVKRNIRVRDTNEWHSSSVLWLTEELAKIEVEVPEKNVVVITHHLPSFKCVVPQYQGSTINYAFASNLDSLIAKSDLWCFGHTHSSVDFWFPFGEKKTRVVANPRGYPCLISESLDSQNKSYDPEKLV